MLMVESFFDQETNTVSYAVADSTSKKCAVIDSVMGFDPSSGKTNTVAADLIIDYLKVQRFDLQWILETHIHADHLSAAAYIQSQLGGKTAIGEHIIKVQKLFSKLFNSPSSFTTNGEQFDKLIGDQECLNIGHLSLCAMHTPGHTPACMSYLIEDALFVGDTLFMPDYGTARADFPGGDAKTLYRSIQKLLKLPDQTRVFTCHDYKAPARDEFAWESSIEQQRMNVHLANGVSEAEFIDFRRQRDKKLSLPRLFLPSVQINMRAGRFPEPASNGISYLLIPINQL
ncbi:MAG: glyoxylase-like metal-dependent hydrolase (beta-lactamase superfamily II) [Psychromonas sp.]|jgi:glyoxylase-like metal-dependent hydrolase (beta-lactamase superfamily II)